MIKKTLSFISWVLILGSLTIAGTCPMTAMAERRVLLAATEYPPYYGAKLPNQGVITEIIREAFKQSGYAVVIRFLPWKRALEATRRGEFDALYSAWYREDRTRWFAFSEPLPIANQIGFFKRVDRRIAYRSIADLKPYKIGIVRGYSNPVEFDRAGLDTEAVTDDRLNMKKLAIGRLDLVLIDRVIGQHIIDTELPESAGLLEWINPPLKTDEQYLIFSKKAAEFSAKRKAFNQGLRHIVGTGKAARIIKRHGF